VNELASSLASRAMRFAVEVMRFCGALPRDAQGQFVADQLFRAGARAAANYRAACRARSKRDFVSKMGMAVEEADESLFWLSFCREAGLKSGIDQERLAGEAEELLAIFVKSAKTASEKLP
jgi:four helix bundle protein